MQRYKKEQKEPNHFLFMYTKKLERHAIYRFSILFRIKFSITSSEVLMYTDIKTLSAV